MGQGNDWVKTKTNIKKTIFFNTITKTNIVVEIELNC